MALRRRFSREKAVFSSKLEQIKLAFAGRDKVYDEFSEKKVEGTLEFYIGETVKNIQNPESPNYRAALASFQKFVANQYKIENAMNNGPTFMNMLLQIVSLSKRSLLEYTVFIRAIISINIGDKIDIANKIANNITNLPPDSNRITWENFEYILKFLSRCLKNIMPIIFALKETSFSWIQKSDKEETISGFYLLSLLMKNFYSMLTPFFSQIQGLLIFGLTDRVSNAVYQTINSAIYLQSVAPMFDLLGLSKKLIIFLNEKRYLNYESLITGLEMILDTYPDYCRYLMLFNSPIELLKCKDNDIRLAGLRISPLYVRLTQNKASLSEIIKSYYDLLKRRSPIRTEALISLANVIFTAKRAGCVIENELTSKLYKKVTKYMDIDEVFYAYIAILTCRDVSTFEKDAGVAFNRSINQYIIDGFYHYCRVVPSKFEVIHRTFLICFNKVLLNINSPADKIIFSFEGLEKLNISTKLIPTALAIRYSMLLNYNNPKVRQLAAKFVLDYQKKNPTIEMLCRILSVICSESQLSNDTRLYLLSNLHKQPVDVSVIPFVMTLLYDTDNLIQRRAFQYFVEIIELEGVSDIITEFLRELEKGMRLSNTPDKTSIRFFNILCRSAYAIDEKPALQNILIPFADFLVSYLLDSHKVFVIGLELLRYMIPVSTISIDLNKLVQNIDNSINQHSSYHRLDSAFELLQVAFQYTPLRTTIYDKHSHLITKLHLLAKLNKNQVNQEKLLSTLSTIGALNPEFQRSMNKILDEMNGIANTPMSFFTLAESTDPEDKLNYASIGISIKTLLEVMNDETLGSLFSISTEALQRVLRNCRLIDDNLLNEVLKQISTILAKGDNSNINTILTHLPTIIGIFGDKFAPLVTPVVDFICDSWNKFERLLLLRIVEWIKITNFELLEPHVLRLANLFVSDVMSCTIEMADMIFSAFVTLSSYNLIIGHVVFPPLIHWINNHATNTDACSQMLSKLAALLSAGGGVNYSSQIIRTMIKIVHFNKNLHDPALAVIRVLSLLMGPRFILFLPSLQDIFVVSESDELSIVIQIYKSGQFIPQSLKTKVRNEDHPGRRRNASQRSSIGSFSSDKRDFSFPFPNEAWSEDLWLQWWEKITNGFLKSSDSRAVSVCKDLAQRYSIIKDKLFPVAFAMRRYRGNDQQNLDSCMNIVLSSAPNNITRGFLSIYEIYDALDAPNLPFNPRIVAKKAVEVDMYALALRLYENVPRDDETIQALVTLNQQLGLPLAANGVLRCSMTNRQAELSEHLGLWEEALKQYQNEGGQNKIGIMNCLRALSRYNELKNLTKTGVFAASAAWHLFQYDEFVKIAEELEENDQSRYYLVIMNIMKNNFTEARNLINKIRKKSCEKVFPALGEDYERMYQEFAEISALSEIEEAMNYFECLEKAKSAEEKVRHDAQESMQRIRQLWNIRFSQLQPIPAVLHDHLCIRLLVLHVSDQRESFLKLIESSLKYKQLELAESIINICETNDKCVEYQVMRCHLFWARGEHQQAINELSKLNLPETTLTLASWLLEVNNPVDARKKLDNFEKKNTAELEVWAQVNLALYESQKSNRNFLVDAFDGLLQCLSIAKSNILTYTLRVLHVLFKYGCDELFASFEKYIKIIPLHVWPDVVIQLMSRLPSSNRGMRKTIGELIKLVGSVHPHAALPPLMVSTYFDNTERQRVSLEILGEIKLQHPHTVANLYAFSSELQKVALSRWEAAVSKIDEASRILISKRPDVINEMNQLLAELDEIVLSPPKSFYEISFIHEYGHIFEVASRWRKVYEDTKDMNVFQIFWKYYTTAFYSIRPMLKNMKNFELSDASPYLANCQDFDIPVPGTYSAERSYFQIHKFDKKVTVIDSKQRPRKIALYGDDGEKYTFLLKAHEDTRLDERIMQLFSFVNTLVDKQMNLPLRDRLSITTYKVIPITPETGLIGWVRNCVTLYDVVKIHREQNNIHLEAEFEETISSYPNYDDLPVGREKIHAFLKGYSACDGCDLKKTLFTQSIDSMDWLQRRTNYAASLAMNSMAGYVLGLGDRHLCNIMINNRSAKLIHIDFGDSFEVAQHRSHFPEKVPFRLTKLLQKALEMGQPEGTFRSSCENTMRIMRTNSEQIIGLLSAFIYDPLRQWTISSGAVHNSMNRNSNNSLGNNTDESTSATIIVKRIEDKLHGNDFDDVKKLNVEQQVERLIDDAMDNANLCQMFKGWYPWW
ncbi:PIKK family atypical protein kinase [Tritrichomonas foetus]|uniref:non-specific serine/threonine protein kinase n=1 Tax=Tritrichomonas foetus TaxID=1144522 RepID=A0A1J4JEB7_9EUKA|nr:PIKK family atypical protein kinase [Tritrichomonas foetus]|eukprot:OHS95604.1 PIKK family atypical protein kinase [Tritrichomonas foetus]